jgi:hypothetical protein
MDIQAIDNAYAQLQQEAGQTSQKLQALAAKLQAAAQSGDQNAREWMLDLREIAVAIQTEENQVAGLLQAMHGFAVSTMQQQPQYLASPPGSSPPGYGYPPQGGNPVSGFLNSGFGRAVEMGLGFGLGDDLINKIF